MVNGQCLCGAHRFRLDGPLVMGHHCHCGFCQKQHGTPYGTVIGVDAEGFDWERAETIDYESSPGMVRVSCATCGSPLPFTPPGLPTFVPAGLLDEFAEPIEFHIFTASKAPWYEINDDLPAFEAYPPGVESTGEPSRPVVDDPGGVRGSCLCGEVRVRLEGKALMARHCHCDRCRHARGAAHASNLVMPRSGVAFTAGEDRVRRFKVPEAEHFTQAFCSTCGGKVPVLDESRGVAIVPLGMLDDPPMLEPAEHIWTSSIPSWSGIHDDLPRFEGRPSAPLGGGSK